MDTRLIIHNNPLEGDAIIHLAGCSLTTSESLSLCFGPTSTIPLSPGTSFTIEAGQGIRPPPGWMLIHTFIFGGAGDCGSAVSRCSAIMPNFNPPSITVEYDWECRSILCDLDNTDAAGGDVGDNSGYTP